MIRFEPRRIKLPGSFLNNCVMHPDVIRDAMKRDVSMSLYIVTANLCDRFSLGKALLAINLIDLLTALHEEE